jgi:methylphosphotriester-DNA--protein-cysteine methyltransferase
VFAANLIAGAWVAGGQPSIQQIRRRGAPQPGQTAELTAAETETPSHPDGGAIVGSSHSRVYHYYNCVYAKKIAPENLVVFKSIAEAKAQGRRPCRICRPP